MEEMTYLQDYPNDSGQKNASQFEYESKKWETG